jgi:hypothetical protein
MGKWLFCKTNHGHEAGSSGATKEKTPRNRRYVNVELSHRQFQKNALLSPKNHRISDK